MTINWFTSMPRGKSIANSPRPFKVTFTIKPRGVRFNAPFARKLKEDSVEYVKIGVDGNMLIIMPSAKENGLRISTGSKGSNAQVCCSPVGLYAENNLTDKSFSGIYNETTQMYEFDLTAGMKEKQEEACGE